MRRTLGAAAAFVVLVLPGLAAAQEPVRTFDQLNTRLKVGDKVYVTDAQGRERSGKILDLSASSLTLEDGGRRTLEGSEVRLVEERERDSLKHGALIGLGVGAGIGVALVAAICSDEQCGAGVALGVGLYGAMGAGIGAGIDAAIPGRKRVVYSAAQGTNGPRVSLSPVVTPRRKGLSLSISF